jgi:hypothetical protein
MLLVVGDVGSIGETAMGYDVTRGQFDRRWTTIATTIEVAGAVCQRCRVP